MAHHTNRTPQDQGHYSMPYGSQTAQYAVTQSPGMAQTFKALQDAGYGQGAPAPASQLNNMRPTFEKPTIYTVSNQSFAATDNQLIVKLGCLLRSPSI
jgi:regulatory protein SWI6